MKMEIYITNFDSNYENEKKDWQYFLQEKLNSISRTNDVFIANFHKKEIDWNDNVAINKLDRTKKDFEKYFE